MRNYLTFDNKDSRDFGVYINGQGTFRAPARSYNVLNIPGRNGDLLGFGSKLENVEITYRAFIYTNFDANIAALRSFLLSHVGYFKLTDSYHPDEYRLAYYKGPFVPDVVANNGAGSFDLTFVCKPQRFLNSGEEVTTLTPAGAEQHTYQGEIVNFSTLAGDKITSARADFHPIQDLHGYDSPWPAGGGKNKLPPNYSGGASLVTSGVTYTNTDGVVNVTGTPTGNAYYGLFPNTDGQRLPLPSGTYTISCQETTADCKVNFNVVGGVSSVLNANQHRYTFTLSSDGEMYANILTNGNSAVNLTLHIQIESGSTATSWEPYSNICPISGRTGLSVYRTGKNLYSRENGQYNVPVYATDGTSASYPDVNVVYIPVKPNTKYTITPQPNSVQYYVRWIECDGNKGYVWRYSSLINSTTRPLTYTTRANTEYLQIAANQYNTANINKNDWEICIQEGTDTTYYPYNGNTYAVDWTSEAGTVYGGTLDVVSGVLTVDRASISSYAGETLPGAWISDRDVYAPGTSPTTGAQVVYELATPLTYQLTAQEIEALADNYMWSDVGQVTVTVTDAMAIENPTLFDAKPLLRVYGAGTLTLGGQTITISTADVYTDIDCEMMDCFKDTVSKNGNVSFSGYDFPVIPPGRNVITMDGVTQVDITPRWWAA